MDRAVTELLETMSRRGADLSTWQRTEPAKDAPVVAAAGEETAR